MAGVLPVLAAGVLASGCTIPIGGAEVGDLRVTWSFAAENSDPSQRCSEFGVDNVTIQLIEKTPAEGQGAKAFGATAACIDGSMIIADVIAGTYVLTAVGEGEVSIFDNGEGLTIEVIANQESSVDAPLVLANGEVVSRVEFQYSFEGNPSCSASNVATINAQVIDVEGNAIAGSNTDCITGAAVVEAVRVGTHTLQVEAVDGDGNVRFVATEEINVLQAGKTVRPNPLDMTAALVDIQVNFSFEGRDSCAEAGVATVDAQLVFDGNVVAGQNVPCVGGSAIFPNMPLDVDGDGTVDAALDLYDLRVFGVDGGGEVLFSANEDGVSFGEDAVRSIVLDANFSTVNVRFEFPEGITCADLGQPNIDIQIVDSANDSIGTNVACIAGDSGPLIAAPSKPSGADRHATIRIDAVVGDDVIFRGIAEGADAEFFPGTNTITIPMVAERGTLEVSWDFSIVDGGTQTVENGVVSFIPGLAPGPPTNSCIEADIDTVIVRVFENNRLLIAQAVDCDDGRVEMPGINNGELEVTVEGIREQDGDAPFLTEDVEIDMGNAARAVELGQTVVGNRTSINITLQPALVFVLLVWTGDCGAAAAATVDIRVKAGALQSGINLPCAQGSQKLGLPPGSDSAPITITLLGVDGQGVPDSSLDLRTIEPVDAAGLPANLVNGLTVFRFDGPE
ncbi:MAG: hypothetical protein Q8O67_02395 [Deltaproteobacteria bacterium]|nr:hypothetical protein [Deltaproteobacteria bacterium]